MFNVNESIERNEIVKNILEVKSLEQLSYSIYQDEYCMGDDKQANECIKYLTDNLKRVYEYLDNMDCVDESIDLYQIGDIINFLDTIEIKEKRD